MKPLTPLQSLIFLVTLGAAIGGWSYGIHWKRVASGSLFTNDEKMMISLRDQIEALEKDNASLRQQLHPPVAEPAAAPEMPPRAQKIETH